LLKRLKRGSVLEVDGMSASKAAGSAPLPAASHYYLVRLGYIGDEADGAVPRGLSFAADVDANRVAYVSSFRLSRSRRTSELAAILTSSTPLRGVVSKCGAAE
jgi:hypothetical protein